MSQPTAYAQERLSVWRRLREAAPQGTLAELFRPAASDLRFRLGTSLADLRIPFKISGSLRRTLTLATIEAYSLAAQRHKAAISSSEYDGIVTLDGFNPTQLRPLAYTVPSAVQREHVRRTFLDAMDAHTGVDAGLVASFIGTGQPGRQLAASIHAVLAKAREESAQGETDEPTIYLAALMLRSAAEGTFALTRDAPIGEPMARYVRSAVAALLSCTTQLALREAGLTKQTGDDHEARSSSLAAAALGLIPFLGPRPAIAASGVSAYGVTFDLTVPWLDEAMERLAQTGDVETVTRDAIAAFQADRELQRRAERMGAFGVLRERSRELARLLDTTTNAALPAEARVHRLLCSRDGLERAFASESKRRDLAKKMKEAARIAPADALRQHIEFFAHAAQGYRDDEPAAWLGAGEARHRTAQAIVAVAADLLLEKAIAPAMQLLLERTGAETQSGDTGEYESGRLYFVSSEPGPLLKDRTQVPQEGHLFCDMKDFTRRTAFLKESVIADFIQREFYAPILAAASGLDPGERSPSAGSGVTLNNLLGDAVSFSGDIVTLMHLAQSIYSALMDYGRRLDADGTKDAVTARLAALERQHQRRRTGLERTIRDLTARAATLQGPAREPLLLRAQEARAELARQTALLEADRARASGEKLEAGIFISYGAAPEVARFEDPYFGPLKVAIAEKINESARGTARHGGVREKLEILRRRASMKIGHELEMPFAVLVDKPAAVSLSPDEAMLVTELLARGDKVTAQERLVRAAQRSLSDASGPGELYNHGIACSEEALRAYIDARGDELLVVRQDIPVSALHPQISGRYFIPRDPLSLVACIIPSSRSLVQLFILQGRALFRGFEATGGLGVYEVLPTRSPLFELFARYHGPQWLKQH